MREIAYIYTELGKARFFRPYGHSYAVVVSASGEWDPGEFEYLPQATRQANEVAELLTQQGFEVTTFLEKNATREHIEAYFEALSQKLEDDDRVLFYFSGHGAKQLGQLGDVGYLLTYPATLKTLFSSAIPMTDLQGRYATLRAKHMLFVLDACFSGLALRGAIPKEDELRKQYLRYKEIATYTRDRARAILVASTKDESALDIKGGIFTKAFISGIKGGADYSHNRVITVDQLSAYIQARVSEEALQRGYQQDPQLQPLPVFGDGRFIFFK